MSETHNVFVSHRHEDDALVEAFKGLLADRNVVIRDASITKADPNDASNDAYIKSEILAPGIEWAGKVVVLITPDTVNHTWVDWEIEYAERRDKEIIGVWGPDSAGCEVPKPLEEHADAIVSWNATKIIEALNGNAHWENPNGSSRGAQPMKRVRCGS